VTRDEPPAWFAAAVAAPRREGAIRSAGVPIHYLEWGTPGLPGLVFVHGGAAHAHWWSFLAPQLAGRLHLAAFDLSGHGDSGWREHYSLEAWVGEVLDVATHAGFAAPPVVVGHSMGGLIAIQAAQDHGNRLAGVVLVDAPLRRPDPESQEGGRTRALRFPSVYPTREAAVARFRLIPAQPVRHPHLFHHIAVHSVREVEDGWTWKFDPGVFRRQRAPMGERLALARCPTALIYGEHSEVVTSDIAAYTAEMMPPGSPVVVLAGAYHHLLLDEPLAFVDALDRILVGWGHLPAPGKG
jgi:pimeloyl-ACP methyl ester carboxylesterase